MDLGDKTSRYCVLNGNGEIELEDSVATTREAVMKKFKGLARCRIAIEVGGHSPWLSRLLTDMGHEVIVANARKVQLISANSKKDDRMDAELLARLARVDPKLLEPIQHRSEAAQLDLMVIRVRAALVETRTALINAARGLAKSVGQRLPSCDADTMDAVRLAGLPKELEQVLKPLLDQVESITEQIKASNERLEQIARTEYPETERLRQVSGVGPLIALTFVLTIEDKERFEKSRDVGCYVGLRPKRNESGESQPQLGITKEGDGYLRTLLVQGAHHILSQRGPDTDLQRFGKKLAERGGKNAKKRAVVAVARKLAVLLHRLWVTGEKYEPLRNSQAAAPVAKRRAA
jgi:transposase